MEGVVGKTTSMKNKNTRVKSTLCQDLSTENEKSFKIVRFTVGRLKTMCNFLISRFFLLFSGRVFVRHLDRRAAKNHSVVDGVQRRKTQRKKQRREEKKRKDRKRKEKKRKEKTRKEK